jgi:hypothetical protein
MNLKICSIISIALVLFACISEAAKPEDRKVEFALNPQCAVQKGQECDSVYLAYFKGTGTNDTIHLMYSTIKTFSILIFKTSPDTNLMLDWTRLLSDNVSEMYDSIKFSKEPMEKAGYALPYIYEFNDTDAKADMTTVPNNELYWVKYKTEDLIWTFDQSAKKFKG